MAVKKPRQGSLPGTNIPELEALAESYYAAIAERNDASKVESEALAALKAKTDELQDAKRLPRPKPDGKKHVVYRYTGDKEDGSTTPRCVYDCVKETRTMNVRNEKDGEPEDEDSDE